MYVRSNLYNTLPKAAGEYNTKPKLSIRSSSHSKDEEFVERFDLEGLHQLQNSFLDDEDLLDTSEVGAFDNFLLSFLRELLIIPRTEF